MFNIDKWASIFNTLINHLNIIIGKIIQKNVLKQWKHLCI